MAADLHPIVAVVPVVGVPIETIEGAGGSGVTVAVAVAPAARGSVGVVVSHPDEPDGTKIIHEYDGIREADHGLPRWWLGTLWGAIAFAPLYWLYFHSFAIAPNPGAEYHEHAMAVASAEALKLKAMGSMTPAALLALSRDPASVEQGKAVFASTCLPCHGANAGGTIGPNLTDAYWLHGDKPEEIYATIRDGVLPKGMPAWGAMLGEERVRVVAAYVLTVRDSNVVGGKAPQGAKGL